MKMRTDSFFDFNGNGLVYYVLWETSTNNPGRGINGNLIGEKMVAHTFNSKTILRVVSYYRGRNMNVRLSDNLHNSLDFK